MTNVLMLNIDSIRFDDDGGGGGDDDDNTIVN